jgi:hypothetical protein
LIAVGKATTTGTEGIETAVSAAMRGCDFSNGLSTPGCELPAALGDKKRRESAGHRVVMMCHEALDEMVRLRLSTCEFDKPRPGCTPLDLPIPATPRIDRSDNCEERVGLDLHPHMLEAELEQIRSHVPTHSNIHKTRHDPPHVAVEDRIGRMMSPALTSVSPSMLGERSKCRAFPLPR